MKSNHAGAVFIKSPHRNKPQANICLIVTRNRQIEESASHTCTAQTLTTDGGKLQQRYGCGALDQMAGGGALGQKGGGGALKQINGGGGGGALVTAAVQRHPGA